ncbi:U11/U12 small nuclear ribonucleoprotein 25 kDa protein isoform X2 [Lampetra planeri]
METNVETKAEETKAEETRDETRDGETGGRIDDEEERRGDGDGAARGKVHEDAKRDRDEEDDDDEEDEEDDDEEDEEKMSHTQFLDVFQEGMARILQDPLLCDLPVGMADTSSYTIEERLVVSIWAHERSHTRKTMKDVRKDFCERFNKDAPPKWTILRWEHKLFSTGSILDKKRTGRPSKRKEQCAAVALSVERSPEKSLRKRSSELGIPKTTLLTCMKDYRKLKSFKPTFVNELSDAGLQKRSEACGQFGEVFEILPQLGKVFLFSDECAIYRGARNRNVKYFGVKLIHVITNSQNIIHHML